VGDARDILGCALFKTAAASVTKFLKGESVELMFAPQRGLELGRNEMPRSVRDSAGNKGRALDVQHPHCSLAIRSYKIQQLGLFSALLVEPSLCHVLVCFILCLPPSPISGTAEINKRTKSP
jgi:hypothetical protein